MLINPLQHRIIQDVNTANQMMRRPEFHSILNARHIRPFRHLIHRIIKRMMLLTILTLQGTRNKVILHSSQIMLSNHTQRRTPPIIRTPKLKPIIRQAHHALRIIKNRIPLTRATNRMTIITRSTKGDDAALKLNNTMTKRKTKMLNSQAGTSPILITTNRRYNTNQ